VVTLPGEIDITDDGHVQDMLARALDDGTAVLIADASRTAFCDCSGARALLRIHHKAAAAGAQLRVAASPAMRRILELTGADRVVDTYPAPGRSTGRANQTTSTATTGKFCPAPSPDGLNQAQPSTLTPLTDGQTPNRS
jgi:anti-anti-sigma factor